MSLLRTILENCKLLVVNESLPIEQEKEDPIEIIVSPITKGVKSGLWKVADYHMKDK